MNYIPVEVKKEKIPLALNNAKRYYDITQRAYDGESYESIGSSWGISRQRVEQIIKKLYISSDLLKTKGVN